MKGQHKKCKERKNILELLKRTKDEVIRLHEQVNDTEKKLDKLKLELREAHNKVDELQVIIIDNTK